MMIKKFVDIFMEHKNELRVAIKDKHPEDYKELVKKVIELINRYDGDYRKPDPKRINEIDDGAYQGTLLYIVAAEGYQPDDYWYVKVSYGSCSVCDQLEGLRDYSVEAPTTDQLDGYMTLCLHIIQQLRPMQAESV